MRRIVAIALSSSLLLQAAPLLAAPSLHGTRAATAQAPVSSGTINGTAQSAAGQKLASYKVQLRNLDSGQLAGTTTSDAAGSFSFASLTPGNYVIEVVDPAGVIVGSSASIPVAAGAAVSVTVSATAAAATTASGTSSRHVSSAVVITSIAAAAGIAGVVAVVRNNASPSR
jgi:hypothetical protein